MRRVVRSLSWWGIIDPHHPPTLLSDRVSPVSLRTRYLPKANLTFTDNYTLYYDMPLGAIFEPSMSVGPEEDEFMTINLVVAVSQCHAICAKLNYTTHMNLVLWTKVSD